MCGIVGYIGTKPFNTDTLKILMLINGYERGMDSTGTYCKEKGIVKDVLDVHDYIVKYSIEPTNLFIGHTRSKTIGAVSKRAAHPFKYKNIVLVHNGTLHNHYMIFNKIKMNAADWEVDSEAIAAKLANDQNPLVLSELKGAAAVLFTDVNNADTMYAFRNKERPLHYVQLTNGLDKWMYISSESESLEVAGFKITDIKEFDENTLYVISKGEILSSQVIHSMPIEYTASGYSTSETSTSNYTPKFESWTDKYVMCDRNSNVPYNGVSYKLELNKFYYVVKHTESYYVTVLIDGDEVTVPKNSFSWLAANHKKLAIGEIGKLNTFLVFNKGTDKEEDCGEPNDLVQVVDAPPLGEITVKNLRNDVIFTAKREWIDFKFIKELVL